MINVQEALAVTKTGIDAVLKTNVPGLSDMTSYLAASTGKGLRALLLLTAAADADGKLPPDAPKAAAALELMHMATLIHDDVIDNASTRRGVPALHHKFGTRNAVICGDYLLSQSMLMFANMDTQRINREEDFSPPIRRVSRALSAVCRGEYLQHLNTGNLDMHLFTYLRIISGKTAALFYTAAYIGGKLGEEPQKAAQDLGRFGRYLGMIFQIYDDCKDYEWTQSRALKPVGSDIKSGVVTLPLLFAIKKNPELRGMAKEIMAAKTDAGEFIQSVLRSGGADDARVLAERYVKKAEQSLADIRPSKRDALLDILCKAKGGV